jgi:hypothetical protein
MLGTSAAFRTASLRAAATPLRTSHSSIQAFLPGILLPTERPRPSKACSIAFAITSAAMQKAQPSDSLSAVSSLKNSVSNCVGLGAGLE